MLITLLLINILAVSFVRADADFTLESERWNGLSEMLSLVAEIGVEVKPHNQIDIGTLSPEDALLVVYPTRELPVLGLTRFMRNGGRVAVFDDYGVSDHFLRAFDITRSRPVITRDSLRIRDNENFLVAMPAGGHPLTENVSALATNHAQALFHRELAPVFKYNKDRKSALVLVGAVGEGRLIVVADSSIFINNMLGFSGNRTFARNLVRYLSVGGRKRLNLVIGDAALIDPAGVFAPRDSLDGIRRALSLIARGRISPLAVHILTAVALIVMSLLAASALARRSPYAAYAKLVNRPETLAGFWGSVRFFALRNRDLLQPLLVFKFELEEALQNKLGFAGPPRLPELAARLREINLPEPESRRLQDLLSELQDLHSKRDLPARPKISPKKFRQLVARGSEILACLDSLPQKS